MNTKLILAKVNSIEVISNKLEELLSELNTKTLNVSINVYNHEIKPLVNAAEEFEVATAKFSNTIRTLEIMCKDIDKLDGDKNITSEMVSILKELHKNIKQMGYKIFALRKAVKTTQIIDITVISKAFIEDISKLSNCVKRLKESDSKLKYKLGGI